MRRADEGEARPAPTVADALAEAEAWNDRAALFATMAYELYSLFAPLHNGEAAYLIQRLGGGASAANPQVIEQVRTELFMAAEGAREEARRILASATDASVDGHVPGLCGEGDVTTAADGSAIKIPSGGDEVVPNPDCPPFRRHLADGAWPLEQAERQKTESAVGTSPHEGGAATGSPRAAGGTRGPGP